jgi:hypothetical protein
MHVGVRRRSSKQLPTLVSLIVVPVALLVDLPVADGPRPSLVTIAEARVGRPASPNSVAGVHRRTRRRTARRVAAGTRVHALPAGCNSVMRRGVKYYSCGGVYYRPRYEGNTVVYVVENP